MQGVTVKLGTKSRYKVPLPEEREGDCSMLPQVPDNSENLRSSTVVPALKI